MLAGTCTRRAFLKTSAAASALVFCPALGWADTGYGFESLPALREMAARKGIYYGAALETGAFQLDPRFRDAYIKECNLIVPENSLKWRYMRPTPDKWNFSFAEKLLVFAHENKMKMRGHTLLYPASLPDWVKVALKDDPKQAKPLIEEHIETVVEHFRGELISWDVVNEAIEPNEGRENSLRGSPLFEALGADYIDLAFRTAAKADPNVQLVYNDFSMESDPVKAQAVLALLRRMKDKGTPIHAVGLQAHISTRKRFDPLASFCKSVKDMGLDLLITELDAFETVPADTDEERDRIVANRTKELLETIFSYSTPTQILTWGISDRHSFLSSKANANNKTGRHIRGLPLDDDFRRKPMWKAIYDTIAQVKP